MPISLQPGYYPVVLLALVVIVACARRWPRVRRARQSLDYLRRQHGE